jgi:hypothetical protein
MANIVRKGIAEGEHCQGRAQRSAGVTEMLYNSTGVSDKAHCIVHKIDMFDFILFFKNPLRNHRK